MPDATSIHVDAALSEFALRYSNAGLGFAAEIVAPRVPVSKQSDYYYTFDKNNLRKIETLRKEKTDPNAVDYTVSTTQYFCDDHELSTLVSDEQRKNADPALDPEQDAVTMLLDTMQLDLEAAVAAILTSTSNITNYYDASSGSNTQWDEASAAPFTNIKTAKKTVLTNCLRPANVMIIPTEIALVLANDSGYLDRYKYVKEMVTPSGLADTVAGLKVIEVSAQYNSAQEGQTDSLTSIWGNHVVIGHVPMGRPSKTTPAGLVNFEWIPRAVRRGRDDKKKSDWIAVSNGHYCLKLTNGAFFYLIDNVLASF